MTGKTHTPCVDAVQNKPKPVTVDYSIDIKDILSEVKRDYCTQQTPTPPQPTVIVEKPKQPLPPPVHPLPTPTPPVEKPPAPAAKTMELDQTIVVELLEQIQRLTREVEQLRAEVNAGTARPILEETAGVSAVPIPEAVPTPAAVPKTAGKRSAKPVKKKAEPAKKPQSKGMSILSSIAFYALLIALVLGAFLLKSHSSGAPFTFAGHAAFTVLTSSMEDTYPKGSLVVTKSVDPATLQVGDDITFMISQSSSVTHRIIGITENYQGTGQRAFETKGTMNEKADKELAIAANVVGKVVFCSLLLGQIAAFVTKNWPFMVFFLVILFALIAFLKWNMGRPDDKEGKRTRLQTDQPPDLVSATEQAELEITV